MWGRGWRKAPSPAWLRPAELAQKDAGSWVDWEVGYCSLGLSFGKSP